MPRRLCKEAVAATALLVSRLSIKIGHDVHGISKLVAFELLILFPFLSPIVLFKPRLIFRPLWRDFYSTFALPGCALRNLSWSHFQDFDLLCSNTIQLDWFMAVLWNRRIRGFGMGEVQLDTWPHDNMISVEVGIAPTHTGHSLVLFHSLLCFNRPPAVSKESAVRKTCRKRHPLPGHPCHSNTANARSFHPQKETQNAEPKPAINIDAMIRKLKQHMSHGQHKIYTM